MSQGSGIVSRYKNVLCLGLSFLALQKTMFPWVAKPGATTMYMIPFVAKLGTTKTNASLADYAWRYTYMSPWFALPGTKNKGFLWLPSMAMQRSMFPVVANLGATTVNVSFCC